jgi:hypothetical protein
VFKELKAFEGVGCVFETRVHAKISVHYHRNGLFSDGRIVSSCCKTRIGLLDEIGIDDSLALILPVVVAGATCSKVSLALVIIKVSLLFVLISEYFGIERYIVY